MTKQGKRVLVIGSAGFIGSHLVECLHGKLGWDVFCVDQGDVDLSKPNAAKELPGEIDYCYHFAGTMPTYKFYELPQELLTNDLRVTLNLAEWAAMGGCKKIIYASSNEVYLDTDVDEDSRLKLASLLEARTSYQVSKIASETILNNWSQKAGFEATSFRLSNVYGPRMHEDQVVFRFLQFAHERVDPFRIGGFDSSRQFIYVADVVRLLLDLRDMNVPVVNVPGEEANLLELARIASGLSGYSPEFVETPRQTGSPVVKRMMSKHEVPVWRVGIEEGLRLLYESLYL